MGLPDSARRLILAAQAAVPDVRLVGGSGLWLLLGHRQSNDLDLFCRSPEDVTQIGQVIEAEAPHLKAGAMRVRTAPAFLRFELTGVSDIARVDVAVDPSTRLVQNPTVVDGVNVEPLRDQRANKIITILGRSELRDLVDLYFLEKNGWPLLEGLDDALSKDGGVDPGWLAWAIKQVIIKPLPGLILPLDLADLERYRDRVQQALTDLAGASR